MMPMLYVPTYLLRPIAHSYVLTPLEIESNLKTLKMEKASGPKVRNRIVGELSVQLSFSLCYLFNQFIHQGIVPACFKDANVCPVPKKGDQSIVPNYRSIPLSISESKVFERSVFKYLPIHLKDNNILSSFQYI